MTDHDPHGAAEGNRHEEPREDDYTRQPSPAPDALFQQLQEALRPIMENLAAGITRAATPVIESNVIPAVRAHLDDIVEKIHLPSITAELPALVETFRRLRDAYVPANLIPLDIDDMFRLPKIASEQRIAVLWTPRTELLRELLAAEDEQQRSATIDVRKDDIVADCREALSICDVEWAAHLVTLLERAIKSFEAGHREPAQALATCVLDTGMTQHFGGKKSVTNIKELARATGEEEEFWRWIVAASVAGIPKAFYDYNYGSGDRLYNRNGSVHCADLEVFNDANAARAISLATGLMRLIKSEEDAFIEE